MKKRHWIIVGVSVLACMTCCVSGGVLTLIALSQFKEEQSRSLAREACSLCMRPMTVGVAPKAEMSQQALISTLQSRAQRLREIADESDFKDELKRVSGSMAAHFERLSHEVSKVPSAGEANVKGAIWFLGLLAVEDPREKDRYVLNSLSKGASDLSTWGMELSLVHAGILQGRRDLASVYARHSGRRSDAPTISLAFRESGGLFSRASVAEDTVFVRNDSGQSLSDCVLIVNIRGRSESVEHAFYIVRWLPNEVRVATLSSGPFRETASGVQSVTATLLCEQLTSPEVQIQRQASGWENSGF